jgi:hypothetical protein
MGYPALPGELGLGLSALICQKNLPQGTDVESRDFPLDRLFHNLIIRSSTATCKYSLPKEFFFFNFSPAFRPR